MLIQYRPIKSLKQYPTIFTYFNLIYKYKCDNYYYICLFKMPSVLSGTLNPANSLAIIMSAM